MLTMANMKRSKPLSDESPNFYDTWDFLSLQNIQDVRGIFQLKPHPRVSLALEGTVSGWRHP